MIGMTNASMSLTASDLMDTLSKTALVIVPLENWSASSAPCSQTIEFGDISKSSYDSYLKGITANSTPIISMKLPSDILDSQVKLYEKDYGCISKAETGGTVGANNGTLTLFCSYRKPTQTLYLNVKGIY